MHEIEKNWDCLDPPMWVCNKMRSHVSNPLEIVTDLGRNFSATHQFVDVVLVFGFNFDNMDVNPTNANRSNSYVTYIQSQAVQKIFC